MAPENNAATDGAHADDRAKGHRSAARWHTLARCTIRAAALIGALLVVFAWSWPGLDARSTRPIEVVNFIAFVTRAFALYVGISMVALAIVAWLFRLRRLAVFVLVPISCFCLIPDAMPMLRSVAPRAWTTAGRYPLGDRPDIIVLSHNTHQGRLDESKLRDAAIASDADIIVVQEASAEYFERLKGVLESTHPHWSHVGQDWLYGHAVFSRFPIIDERTMAFAVPPPVPHPNRMRDGDMQQRVTLGVAGRLLVIQNLHLISPMNPTLVAEQGRQFVGLLSSLRDDDLVSESAPPLLLIGDFNSTHRSLFHTQLRALGLTAAHPSAGAGPGGTWPSTMPRLLGFRLDHAFVNKRLIPRHSRVLDRMGSDHRGIVVGFDFRESKE
jgi:endonuclease/exonuclease/phosphatase (EEP) superfamily protein YafD